MSKPERQKYKIAGPATWELIRAAYLAGESAPALAERFGVSAHAIRKRITVEKWSKRAYAEALEARGLEAPARPKALNVAARFAASYAPPPAREEPEHPFMALVEALKEASQAAARVDAADDAIEEAPVQLAASLERRAMAQASAALTKGRANDAKAFAALAEQMRKLAAEGERVVAAEAEAEQAEVRSLEEKLVGQFRYAALLAYYMVHNPLGAPAIFVDSIAAVRREAFGEGDEESLAKARASAEESRRYFRLDEEKWQAAFAATSTAEANGVASDEEGDDEAAEATP